jgi:hypothetical protein
MSCGGKTIQMMREICDGAQADMRAGGREAVSRKQRQRVGGDYECFRGLSESESESVA